MIERTLLQFDIEPIIEQVKQLSMTSRSLVLNETKGNILSGDYTTKPEFVDTPLGYVLECMGDIGEARLLRLDTQETYTAHTDPDDRYHLNIISNEHSYLIDLETNTMHSLPVDGYIYYMDTSVVHTAVNFGSRERIHLNVRARMPKCHDNPRHIKFVGGDFDWKYSLYYDLMKFLNLAVKMKDVTGLEKINDREILINCDDITLEQIRIIANKCKVSIE